MKMWVIIKSPKDNKMETLASLSRYPSYIEWAILSSKLYVTSTLRSLEMARDILQQGKAETRHEAVFLS